MTVPADVAPVSSRDHGCLPNWRDADLPEPLPFSFWNMLRTIGPGAILLAGAIGGGEWIVGPKMAVDYGTSILWIATIGIILQATFNLEAIRYTLYTGEPILTGIMRLSPGPKFWAPFYILLGVTQLAIPALAAGCAVVVFGAFAGHMPSEANKSTLDLIARGVIVLSALMLLSGKSIEKLLEKASWAMIMFIFAFLIFINLYAVPFETSFRTLRGFLTIPWFSTDESLVVHIGHTSLPIRIFPASISFVMLGLFAATSGSGGLGNLAVTNWFRDKGFGMGAHVGGIGGALSSEHATLQPVGAVFPLDESNTRKWKTWWKYALLDQQALWAGGCFLGMYLNVNLAIALIPPGEQVTGYNVGAFQAEHLAKQLWQGLWLLTLLNGFWILYSTHLGNTDVLVRTVADTLWAACPPVRRWPASRLYAVLLIVLTAWALFSVGLGTVLDLFSVLGIVASPILAIAAVQILRINLRFLPRPLQPSIWRCIGLILCTLAYGTITVALIGKMVLPE